MAGARIFTEPPAFSTAATAGFAIDPICKMKVNPAAPKGGSFEFQGTTYYFCNPKCREKFAADPERYLAEPPAVPVAAEAGTALAVASNGADHEAESPVAEDTADAEAVPAPTEEGAEVPQRQGWWSRWVR